MEEFREGLKDPIFIKNVGKVIGEVHQQRSVNAAKYGRGYFKRDWYDRMCDDGQLSTSFIIGQAELIATKKSELSSTVRKVVGLILRSAFLYTQKDYADMEAKKATTKPKKK